MNAVVYSNLKRLRLWRIALPNPFMVAMLVLCILMFAIYCLGVGIPESVLPLCFVVVLPFFKEKDFLALGACLSLVGGIPHFREFLILVVLVYFCKYFRKFKLSSVMWVVLGFVLIEIIDYFVGANDNFNIRYFLGWAGGLFYFALCINLLLEVKPMYLLRIMKYYVLTYCCVGTILLQRFAVEAGGLLNLLVGGKRLGDMRTFYGFEKITTEVNNGLSFNPNTLGVLSVLSVGVCLIFLYLHYGPRWVWIGVTFFASMITLMTLSRAGVIAWIVVVSVYFFDLRSLSKFIFTTLGVIFIVGGLIFILYSCNDSVGLMVDNMVARLTMPTDISAGRLDLWELWNDYYYSNPQYWLTGIGANNIGERLNGIGIQGSIHNFIQEAYVYWGIIGLVLMFVLNWSIYKISKQAAGGKLIKLNFLLMIALCLGYLSGQYLTAPFDMQIIGATVMAYPFWKYKDVCSEIDRFSEEVGK